LNADSAFVNDTAAVAFPACERALPAEPVIARASGASGRDDPGHAARDTPHVPSVPESA